MPASLVAWEQHGIDCNRLFGAIRQFFGAYPPGRPESLGWSHRGKGHGCEAFDGAHPACGKVKNRSHTPPKQSRKQTSTWRVAACCGQGQFLSRGSEAIVTHTIPE
jgi:hypothetical protein